MGNSLSNFTDFTSSSDHSKNDKESQWFLKKCVQCEIRNPDLTLSTLNMDKDSEEVINLNMSDMVTSTPYIHVSVTDSPTSYYDKDLLNNVSLKNSNGPFIVKGGIKSPIYERKY